MSEWDYNGAFLRYPISSNEEYVFNNGSTIKVHDIMQPVPDFMKTADLLFVDPPWNKGNLNTFYTKAEIKERLESFECFYFRLFECVKEIGPNICYLEIGKQYLAEFIVEMKKIYKYVAFYNSTYYHNKNKLCYVVRGSNYFKKPSLDYLDEEDIIEWVCKNEDYKCIGDLCIGRGLVGINAYKNNKKFVGTELNHKRLSVLIEKIKEDETK